MKTFISIILICLHHFAMAQNVVQAEYFLDNDAGFGQNKLVSLAPAAEGTFLLNIDLVGVSPGFHKLYIRTKSSDGKWAHTTRRLIEVVASEATNKIVSGEYFFDADPGFDNGNLISVGFQDSVILQNFTAAVNALSPGYHKFYSRFKDVHGNWSQVSRRNIEVAKGGSNAVMMVEYFFDKDAGFGNCSSFTFANPVADGSFAFNIPVSEVVGDVDTLFLRIRDSANTNWSITSYRVSPVVVPLTLLDFSAILSGNMVLLNWATTNEINTAYFHIERSSNGINFSEVGRVYAKGTGNTPTRYNYDDDVSNVAVNKIFYRLKMADKDGSKRYSKAVAVNIARKNSWFVIKPNPAQNFITITLDNNAVIGKAELLIRDMAGQTIMKEIIRSGGSQIVNISRLAKGAYLLTVTTPAIISTGKFVVE